VEQAIFRTDESLKTQEGYGFEKMIRLLTEECSRKDVGDFPLTEIVQGYWNKPHASDIEIDLIAHNDETKTVRLGSCKRSAGAHDVAALKNFDEHMDRFFTTKEGRRFSGWTLEKTLYSPTFSSAQRQHLDDRGYLCRDLNDFARFLGRPTMSLFNIAET
jgi:hypothetical protein